MVRLLQTDADELVGRCAAGLPRTLLHGDAKVANFALLPTGVAALDWSWVGAGPCTLDLGWYLAVNAGRLARPKPAVIGRYRVFLEAALESRLADEQWSRLVAFGVLAGARLLLWEKALVMQSGSARATAEWKWWLQALEQVALDP
jgi:aminoglycoside phosphotransferase (APT) family kinase protein